MSKPRRKLPPPAGIGAVKHSLTGAGMKCKCGERYGNMIQLAYDKWQCSNCKGYPRAQPQVFTRV